MQPKINLMLKILKLHNNVFEKDFLGSTHFAILRMKADFVNRKSTHSLNVQVESKMPSHFSLTDYTLKSYMIFSYGHITCYTIHDSLNIILQESVLGQRFEEGLGREGKKSPQV